MCSEIRTFYRMLYLVIMGSLGFRSHHVFHVMEDPMRVEERVRRQMRRNNPSDLKLRRQAGRLFLRFPSHDAHMVTPQMELRLSDAEDGGTTVHAIIGPSFGFWKFTKAALLVCALLGLIGSAIAFLQWNTGGLAWGFYLMMIGLAGWLFLYFLMQEAKRRDHDRLGLLKDFMDNALGQDCFGRDGSARVRPALP